jgi:hypothetical protein
MTRQNRLYPHLLPVDIPVWERWLELHQQEYHLIEYDVRVGEGRPAPPYYPVNIQKMALDLSMRRIDAVAHTLSEIVVIEVTKRAGLKAVGQLLVYPILYRLTFDPPLGIRPLLVCEQINTDILAPLETLRLDYDLLPNSSNRIK